MTNQEKKEFLKKEKAKLELSKKLVDFSKQMSQTITAGMTDTLENLKNDTKRNAFTYKKDFWLWK